VDGPKKERVGCPLDWKPGEVVRTPARGYVGKVTWGGTPAFNHAPQSLAVYQTLHSSLMKHEAHATMQHARVAATVARCCRRQACIFQLCR
jgi:hypothetical protein